MYNKGPSRCSISNEVEAKTISPCKEKEVRAEDEVENECNCWNKPCENMEN